jgi:hypothetical protein
MNAPLVDRQPSNRIERLEALGIVWKLKAQQRLRRRNAMGIEPGDSYQSISLACHDALTWRTRVSPATTPGKGTTRLVGASQHDRRERQSGIEGESARSGTGNFGGTVLSNFYTNIGIRRWTRVVA